MMEADLKTRMETLGFYLGECARIKQELQEKPVEYYPKDVRKLVHSYKICVNKVIRECEYIIFNSEDYELTVKIENLLANYNMIKNWLLKRNLG